jgi:hypothetical protein
MPRLEGPFDVALLFVCCGLPFAAMGALAGSAAVETAGAILVVLGLIAVLAGAARLRFRRPVHPHRDF